VSEGNGHNGQLTADQLRELRAGMTWGDQRHAVRKAKAEAKGGEPDNTEVAVLSMHRAAVRAGIADDDVDAFLDRVRIEDLQAVLKEREGQDDPT